jgi:lysophospholipase L1-like esterase
MAIQDQQPDVTTMVESDGVWKNLLFHSSFSGLSKDELALRIKAILSQVKKHLANADWLMITFGTAFIYNYQLTGQPVANCQKLPSQQFTRTLASNAALMKDFTEFLGILSDFNKKIKLILTVSPVRHVKDGLAENSVSKSILRLLCNNLARDSKQVFYYPAYEIMVDDLRDYRFYEEDLIHPNKQATDYIWQHFSKSFFTSELIDFLGQWQKVRTSLNHKPFNPASYEHQQFLKKLLFELRQLNDKVDLTKEIARVEEAIFNEQ